MVLTRHLPNGAIKAKSGRPAAPPQKILAIDIGGTKVKVLATGQTEARKIPSGKKFTPALMVERVHALVSDWEYDAVSIGYPGLVGEQGPRSEPGNLGPGWVGFDYALAFDKPVRIINDAAMQAMGSYEGGRMLFLGFGTGLGSTLIADRVIVPLELGRLLDPSGQKYGLVLGRAGLKKLGKKVWREQVQHFVQMMSSSFVVDYVVLGGGNAKNIKDLPHGARLGHNLTAFRGGFRLWNVEDVQTLSADSAPAAPPAAPIEWRLT